MPPPSPVVGHRRGRPIGVATPRTHKLAGGIRIRQKLAGVREKGVRAAAPHRRKLAGGAAFAPSIPGGASVSEERPRVRIRALSLCWWWENREEEKRVSE